MKKLNLTVNYQKFVGPQDWLAIENDEGKTFYCVDANKIGEGYNIQSLSDDRIQVSTELIEAMDPAIREKEAKCLGIIDNNGVEIIPCVNHAIRPISDNIYLVEIATPVSESVIKENEMRSDPSYASQIIQRRAKTKNAISQKVGEEGKDQIEYKFNNSSSECTLIDKEANNIVNGEYYSYVAMYKDNLYLAKNEEDTDVKVFSLTDMKFIEEEKEVIDVSQVEVPQEVVENSIENVEVPTEKVEAQENINQGFSMEDMQAPTLEEDQIVDDQVGEEISIPTEEVVETPKEEAIDNNEEVVTTPVEEIPQDISYEVVETPKEETPIEDNTNDMPYEIKDEPVEEAPQDISYDAVETPKEEAPIEDTSIDMPYEIKDEPVEDVVETPEGKEESFNYEEEDKEPATPAIDDMFKDWTQVKPDSIEIDKDFDNSTSYIDDTNGKARVVTDLMNEITNITEESKMKDEKIDMLTDQSRSYKVEVSKLESRNDMLQSELRERERKIESQDRYIETLLQQLDNYKEIVKTIDDAEAFLRAREESHRRRSI